MSDKLHPENKPRTVRIVGVVNGGIFIVVIGIGLVAYLTPLQDWLADGIFIKEWLALFGIAAPFVFILATACLTFIGTPRLLLSSLGGMSFGFAWGLAWAQLGTLIGSYVIFMFIRWRGREYALHHFPRIRGFSHSMKNCGLMAVVMLRQLPINGFYNNVLLGLTPVRHGEFLLGSLLGFLPLGISACLLGAGLIQRDLLKGVRYIALGFACSVILGFILNRLANKVSATRDHDPS